MRPRHALPVLALALAACVDLSLPPQVVPCTPPGCVSADGGIPRDGAGFPDDRPPPATADAVPANPAPDGARQPDGPAAADARPADAATADAAPARDGPTAPEVMAPPPPDVGPATPDMAPLAPDSAPDAPALDAPAPPDAAPLPNGAACTAGARCASGLCADGICCNDACTNPCNGCSTGTCRPLLDGASPRGECKAEPAPSCGLDGKCDGRGACRRWPAGTLCAAAACASSSETPARTCDGSGVCRSVTARACTPYGCTGTACATSCDDVGDCQAGHVCDADACKPQFPTGTACTAPQQCLSGACSGACCSGPCPDPCASCNVPGAAGMCLPLPATARVVHLAFDDGSGATARDSACPRDDAALVGFGAGGWRSGRSGGALAFDGVTSWARLPDGPALDRIEGTGQVTVAVWVLRTTAQPPAWIGIVTRQFMESYGDQFGLFFHDNILRWAVMTEGGGQSHCDNTAGQSPNDQWIHVAGTYDGNNASLYVNGALACTLSRNVPLGPSTNHLTIGGSTNLPDRNALSEAFTGALDELLLYSRVLSAQEIAALAGGGVPPQN